MEQKIAELVAKNYWEPAMTPYSVTAMLVKRPGKTGEELSDWRIVSDWRNINKISVLYPNCLPSLDQILGDLAGSTIFSSVDLRSGFDQQRTDASLRQTVGVLANRRLFASNVLSQGYRNASTLFQSMMENVLAGSASIASHDHRYPVDLRPWVKLYIDDLYFYSKSVEEHALYLKLLLLRLWDNELFLNLDKVLVGASSCRFLRFELGKGAKWVPADRVQAMLDIEAPATRKALHTWLGKTNYLRAFIQGYPQLTEHQQAALNSKETVFTFPPAAVAEFEELKKALTSLPVLQLPRPELIYYLTTDASSVGLGAALWQRRPVDGKLGPVAYWSRKLQPNEQKMHINELETIVARDAMVHFRYHLTSSTAPFILLTDSSFLYQLRSTAELKPRHRRIIEAFADFNFLTFHLKGSENDLADLLSRGLASSGQAGKKHLEQLASNDVPPKGLVTELFSTHPSFEQRLDVLLVTTRAQVLKEQRLAAVNPLQTESNGPAGDDSEDHEFIFFITWW